MRTSSRTVVFIALFAALAFLATACPAEEPAVAPVEPEEEPVEPEEESVELTFLGSWSSDFVNPTLEAYRQVAPWVTFSYEEVPFGDLNELIMARVGAGDPTPDIFGADQPRVSALVERGLLADLTEAFPDIEEWALEVTAEAVTVDGRIYAAPTNTSTALLFYNREHLEAAGVEPPTADPDERWTWQELKEAAAASQEAGATWGFQFFQVSRIYQMQALVESAGGGSGVQFDNGERPDVTNEGWVRAMEFFQELHEEGISPRGIPPEQMPEMFEAGELTFYISGDWDHARWAWDLDFEYGIAPHPYFEDGEPVTPTGSWAMGANPNSEHLDEVQEFLRWIAAEREGAETWLEQYGTMTSHASILEEVYLQSPFLTEGHIGEWSVGELIQYELENTARIRAPTARWVEFETIIGDAMEDIRNGLPVSDTLEAAQEELERVWGAAG